MRVGDQRHAPPTLPPGNTRYLLYRGLVGPQGRSGRVWKISLLTGFRSPDRPSRSESLYRLRYPGPQILYIYIYIYINAVVSTQERHCIFNTRTNLLMLLFTVRIIKLKSAQEHFFCVNVGNQSSVSVNMYVMYT